jgi:tryparedoxin peroxidase (2-Cys peroxiredoxin)
MFRRFSAAAFRGVMPAVGRSAAPSLRFCAYDALSVAQVQREAPAWTAQAVVNGQITNVSLQDYRGKYVVIIFYPLDFTFVCPTEIIDFSERSKEFEEVGAQVLAVSVDSPFSHLAWTKTDRKKGGLGEMKIPLVSDLTKDIARDYGVLIEEKGIALRGQFIIDGKGVLRSMTVNDLPVGRNVDEALRLVQAFQLADKTGDVVPCGWKPGKKTMNVAKADEYFSQTN